MYAHEAIRLRLRADAGVSAITTRIYKGVLTQSVTYPAVAYRGTDEEAQRRLETFTSGGISRLELRFFSTTNLANGGADRAYALDRAIKASLEGFSGTITDTSVTPNESVSIQGIFHQRTFEAYDDKSQTYQVITDYEVWAYN